MEEVDQQYTRKSHRRGWLGIAAFAVCLAVAAFAVAQYQSGTFAPPAPYLPPQTPSQLAAVDSAEIAPLPFGTGPIMPYDYEDYAADELATDLRTPSNIKTTAEYDPVTGMYVVRTRVGDMDITTPLILTPQQYNDIEMRRSMIDYYHQRNAELANGQDKQPFNILDMNFAIGPLEKIFGPGGVSLKTQGSV